MWKNCMKKLGILQAWKNQSSEHLRNWANKRSAHSSMFKEWYKDGRNISAALSPKTEKSLGAMKYVSIWTFSSVEIFNNRQELLEII